jgi:hypothetical protein
VLNAYLDGDLTSHSYTSEMTLYDLCTVQQSSLTVVQPFLIESEKGRRPEDRFIRQEAQEEVKEQSLNLEKGMQLLQHFHDQCMLCVSVRSQYHSISHCKASDRASYDAMVQLIRRTIRYERFSGCFRCGLPQSLCQAWISTDQGFRTKADQECQYRGSLSEAAAIFLYDVAFLQRIQAGFQKRFQIGSDRAKERSLWQEQVVRQLGRKVRWLNLETNVLFQEVLELYIQIS